MKRRLTAIAQALIALLLLGWILARLRAAGTLNELGSAFLQAGRNWPILCIAVLCFIAAMFLCSYRWWMFLKAVGARLPFRSCFALYFVGQFFNAFMLGSTGGDVMKAYYAAAESHGRRTEVAATVFIDRIAGLIALVLLLTVVMALRLPFFLRYPETRLALVFNSAVVVATLVGIIAVINHRRLARWPAYRRLEASGRFGALITRTYQAFGICLSHPALLVKTLLLSLANHQCYIVSAYYFGLAIGIDLSPLTYITLMPMIAFVSSIPITPSGLGTREQVSILLFGAVGVSAANALTLSLLLYACMLFWSLVGAVVYLGYVAKRPKPALPVVS